MTPEAALMQEIVSHCAPALRAANFRKRRHSFNRHMPSGLVHVVNFWQAPKEPPAWTEIPGFRERLYGTFRVDFGVWVPEITRMGEPRSTWINEYDCDLRATMGRLLASPGDDPRLLGEDAGLWWELDHPEVASAAEGLLLEQGIPWLDLYPDHEAILRSFDEYGAWPIGLTPAGPLDVAQMCAARGDKDTERRILEAYVSEPMLWADHTRDYLTSIGYPDLAVRVTEAPPNRRRRVPLPASRPAQE